MILLRHGQSEFNAVYSVTRVDPGIADPRLTAEGRQQAALAVAMLGAAGVRRLISSPYTRALETASLIAEALQIEVSVEPLVRERAAFACDIGASPAELQRRFPRFRFDHLEDPWWHDHIALGIAESEAALAKRCAAFRDSMSMSPDWRHVGVVTHWGFIRAMTGRTLTNGELVRVEILQSPP
jgi:broad specificity phosphatase PhoE